MPLDSHPSPSDDGVRPLFGHLPPDLFRLFTGSSRWFYADLLAYLDGDVFDGPGGIVTKHAFLNILRDYLDRQGRGVVLDDEDPAAAANDEQRVFVVYNRLHSTGWLVEHRDRYRRLVDLDGSARLMLQALLDIKAGRSRSYGGEVLQVLALIEAALADPDNRSEALRNAARSARGFLNHLRSMASGMRQVEEALVAQTEARDLFRRFFEDFVSDHLIEDFKRLHTQANPFRYRVRIIEMAEGVLADDALQERLAQAGVREGRCADLDAAVEQIIGDLRSIIAAFERVDDYLELIEETNGRIERRVRNTVRYLDRIAEMRTDRLRLALEMLGRLDRPADALVDVASRITPFEPPLGPDHLYKTPAARAPIVPQKIIAKPRDLAYERYLVAVQGYRARTQVTPARLRDYLERACAGHATVAAADLPIETLDDFFVFERLRALIHTPADAPAGYSVEALDGVVENDWIRCPAFRVRRFTTEISNAA